MFFFLGQTILAICEDLGKFGIFSIRTFVTFFRRGCNPKFALFQMANIGIDSCWVVVLTGSTIGAILAMHGYSALKEYGTFQFLGELVYLSMTREFGCILSAIMVIARAGSAMTAEIGSMNISEQIDALTTLSIDPIRYIVIPRVIASTFILPFLSLFCVLAGVSAGYIMSVFIKEVNSELYIDSIRTNVEMGDITKGLIKAAIFGLLFSLICAYKGIHARGGARGIGVATTESVVYSCVTIFVANYILSSILF